jgi:hypothetical protein
VIVPRQLVGDLEERLVRDANVVFAETFPRPVHVDVATPGSFGDLARPHLEGIRRLLRSVGRDAEFFAKTREVIGGDTPVASLPPALVAAVVEAGPDLDGLFAATRASVAGVPEDGDPGKLDRWPGIAQFAARLAGVRLRLTLEAGEPELGIEAGLDGLALGRDAAIGQGLLGHMVGVAIVNLLTPAVGAALDALPDAAARRDAAGRLRTIRDAFPPFTRTLEHEAVGTQLLVCDVLSTRTLAGLGPRARGECEKADLLGSSFVSRLIIRDGWRDLRKAQDDLIAAADLPARERSVAWNAVRDRLKRLVNGWPATAVTDYERYALRAETLMPRLDALVLAAAAGAFREATARWPRTVGELAQAGELQEAETARLTDARLEVVDGGRAMLVIVPLSRVHEDDPEELRLRLRAPAAPRR